MPLTPQEQAELSALQSELSPKPQGKPRLPSQDEMAQRLGFPNQEEYIKALVVGYAPMNLGKLLGSVVGKPARGIADFLMRRSVGIKDAVPGIGNELVDAGLVGPKFLMRGQVANKLPAAEAGVQKAVSNIPGFIPSQPVAAEVTKLLDKKLTSGGKAVSGSEGDIQTIVDRAKSIAARGDVSPKEALELARGAESSSYKVAPGEIKPGINPKMGAAEGRGYKSALKDLSPEVESGLKREQALILAQKALKKPESLAGTVASYASNLAGAAPTAGTLGAQALQKGVPILESAADPLTKLLVQEKAKSAPLSSSEQDELSQLRAEFGTAR